MAAAISAADKNLRLVISFSIGYEKPPHVASLWKWSSDRPIKVTFPHVASTPREVGRVGTIISLSSTSRRVELCDA
jgi:hypothetical protein